MLALAANAAILEMEDADVITEEVLEAELNQLIGTRDEDYTLTKNGTIFTIKYINSNRSYSIEETGKVLEKIEPTNIDDWLYTIDEDAGTAVINVYKGTDTEIVIPNYIGEYKVVGIEPQGKVGIWDESICEYTYYSSSKIYRQDTITKITIPVGITYIGDKSFNTTNNLVECIIPNSVTSIGNGAFSYCKSLISVKIPESVIEMGQSAFYTIHASAVITCDFESKPDGWHDNWTGCSNIVWTKAAN